MGAVSVKTTNNDQSRSAGGKPISRERGPLRICMVAYAFYESDTRILQYASALRERGDLVDVIALRRDSSQAGWERIDGVNVYRLQTRTINEKGLLTYASRIARFFLKATLFLRRQHNQIAYDLVHVHNVPDFLVFTAIFPKLRGVPIVLDIHDILPEFYASKFKVHHRSLIFKGLIFVERCSAAFASHVIVANDLWCNRLASRSSRPGKCSVVRNHPDLSVFIPASHCNKRTGGRFILTYPGSLNFHQGLDVAIRAFARIAPAMPEAEFHIYGEGPAKISLIDLATALKIKDRVMFHEFLPSREIARVMAMTDLAIEPKRTTSPFGNEALSTKVLEFMILGVPIVASRTKIHAHYYDDSLVRYYDGDNYLQLADEMLQLMQDPEARQRLAANGRAYAQHNTWGARKGEYLALIDSLIRA